MTFFLILMVVGLAGLVCLALPGLLHHGGGDSGAHHLGPDLHIGHGHGLPAGDAAAGPVLNGGGGAHGHILHPGDAGHHSDGAVSGKAGGLALSPRTIFSLLALYGAFGYALAGAANLTPLLAGILALLPALALERFVITPLWNLMFRFQGKPDTPLQALVMQEAVAVTPFTNGRGIVSVVRDGRAVQFSARLAPEQAGFGVRVGDRLQIEDVDAARERLTVSPGTNVNSAP